jgi:hypothetical protein
VRAEQPGQRYFDFVTLLRVLASADMSRSSREAAVDARHAGSARHAPETYQILQRSLSRAWSDILSTSPVTCNSRRQMAYSRWRISGAENCRCARGMRREAQRCLGCVVGGVERISAGRPGQVREESSGRARSGMVWYGIIMAAQAWHFCRRRRRCAARANSPANHGPALAEDTTGPQSQKTRG